MFIIFIIIILLEKYLYFQLGPPAILDVITIVSASRFSQEDLITQVDLEATTELSFSNKQF